MEHKAAVGRRDRNNGIAVHAWDEDHRIDWEGINIKEVEQQLWKRKALEAVHIHMQPNSNNLDRGLILSDVWLPFMKKQQCYQYSLFTTRPRSFIETIVHVRTRCSKNRPFLILSF